jgi:hypothetical protein
MTRKKRIMVLFIILSLLLSSHISLYYCMIQHKDPATKAPLPLLGLATPPLLANDMDCCCCWANNCCCFVNGSGRRTDTLTGVACVFKSWIFQIGQCPTIGGEQAFTHANQSQVVAVGTGRHFYIFILCILF